MYDYRYRSDPSSPFRLYDCLGPTLKKHELIPNQLLPSTEYNKDLVMQMELKRARAAVKAIDNKVLHARIIELE